MAQSSAWRRGPPCSGARGVGRGLADRRASMTLDRAALSGLQAVIDAAMQVQTGAADVVSGGPVSKA